MKKHDIQLDKIGMCTSFICMVHCMSVPLLFLFGFDALLRSIGNEWIELAIVAIMLVIGMVSFLGGFIEHRQHYILVLFLAGFILFVNGENVVNEWISLSLSISGSLIIIYAHAQNLKWKRSLLSN